VQPLRLTLRTLLAYLDDTLEPAQAKLIGQKIAESEQARELIERIKTVTRRRRITTPAADDPGGKLDPNTVGEYLDNTVSPERAAEVEEICLASDAHLAEVAACHQILSLILGEPALVPAPARQRMYGVVKGPEAIPFRKPPASSRPDVVVTEARDIDDTLRLGIPPVTGQHRGNPWILAVGGVVAAGLLLFAIWQILKRPDTTTVVQQPTVVAQNDPSKEKKVEPVVEQKPVVVVPKKDDAPPLPEKKDPTPPLPEVKKDEIQLPPVQLDTGATPPSNEQKVLGKFVFDAKEPGVLLERVGDMNQWQRVGLKNPGVSSGRPLVSLPATTSPIQLASGVKLSLVGLAPELFPLFPLYESAAELHANEQFDLDMTLRRGRVRIQSEKDKPAKIRVRFENPTLHGVSEAFDITLATKGSEVLLDRWTSFGERFFRNPKDPLRTGPMADMTVVVLSGSATVKANDVSYALTAPPGKALLRWNSRRGEVGESELKTIPDGLKGPVPLPQGADRFRKDLIRARDDLSKNMATKPVDVVLAESLQAQDKSVRRIGVLSLGATDDVGTLIDLLAQEADVDLRVGAIEVLRNWITTSRDSEYKLYELLKAKYRGFEADAIMALLHGFSPQDLSNPDTFESLIGALDHPQLPVRELANWRLYTLMPEAHQKIRYSATADAAARQQAQREWRKLIPPGKLPPMPKPAPK
jgi:hypothetical protein